MTESKFTSSIARQINMNFWFRQFFIFILMDMLMILLTAGVFFQWDIRKIFSMAFFRHERYEE